MVLEEWFIIFLVQKKKKKKQEQCGRNINQNNEKKHNSNSRDHGEICAAKSHSGVANTDAIKT